jgi:hypothetical protein
MLFSSEVNEMRFSWLVVVLAVAGCGNKNTQGQDMAAPDDLSMAQGGDMAMSTNCSLTKQDCGPGLKCVILMTNSATLGTCVNDGTKTDGQPCTYDTSNQNVFNDDCKAGLTCDSTGTGNNNTQVCRQYCATDSGCADSGQRCLGFDVGVGWCIPFCTPFTGTGCPAGADCGSSVADVSWTQNAPTGFFVCKQTGAGGAFATCMQDSDCGVGLYCDAFGQMATNTCLALCDSGSHTCPTPIPDSGITTTMCNAYTDQAGKGFCSAM